MPRPRSIKRMQSDLNFKVECWHILTQWCRTVDSIQKREEILTNSPRLEDRAAFSQRLLLFHNRVDPLFPTDKRACPQRECITFPAQMDECDWEAALGIRFVGGGRCKRMHPRLSTTSGISFRHERVSRSPSWSAAVGARILSSRRNQQ